MYSQVLKMKTKHFNMKISKQWAIYEHACFSKTLIIWWYIGETNYELTWDILADFYVYH